VATHHRLFSPSQSELFQFSCRPRNSSGASDKLLEYIRQLQRFSQGGSPDFGIRAGPVRLSRQKLMLYEPANGLAKHVAFIVDPRRFANHEI
jgi:hypothetical protein